MHGIEEQQKVNSNAKNGYIFNMCFCGIDMSNIIDVASIIVNILLTYYIVNTLQEKVGNKRIQKNYYLDETREIQKEYKTFIAKLTNDSIKASEVMEWFKSFTIKSNDLLEEIGDLYSIDKNSLHPILVNLRKLIDDMPDFQQNFNKKSYWKLAAHSRNQIIEFQKNKNTIFSNILMSINNK